MAIEAGQSPAVSAFSALFNELRKLGYVEGRNLIVERYSALGRPERYAEPAREATRAHPDLIVSSGNTLVRSLQTATDTIPIVAAMADPVAFGLAASLARPGANPRSISACGSILMWLSIIAHLVRAGRRASMMICAGRPICRRRIGGVARLAFGQQGGEAKKAFVISISERV
jgi:hypothetical protein